MPNHYRRNFDIVCSSGNLDVGLMPNHGLKVMNSAVKKGGIVAFSIKEKLLNPKTDRGTGYSNAIQKLIDNKTWKPLGKAEFADTGKVPDFSQSKANQ